MHICPQARTENIVTQELDKELLLYDLNIDKAFSLNETSAIIWHNCDGQTSFDELKKQVKGLTDEVILLALNDFQKENLLDGKVETGLLNDRISRRKVLLKYATAAFAIPVIISFVAPKAVDAQSGCIPDNGIFTLMSTDTNDCGTPPNFNMCCSQSIKVSATDGISIVTCTCGITVVP